MIDHDAINREFLTVNVDKPMTKEDLQSVQAAAIALASTRRAYDLEDMTAVALMFGIKHWMMQQRPELLSWPIASEGTNAFCWNLLWQMSEIEPDGPFAPLRIMVSERAASELGGPIGDEVAKAFSAGLALGAADRGSARAHTSARSRMNDLLLSYTQARKDAAGERRAKLLAFAKNAIASDPHVTTAEIAREFRKVHRPTSALSTDLEDREVSAWRRAGVLPERVLRKIANKSG